MVGVTHREQCIMSFINHSRLNSGHSVAPDTISRDQSLWYVFLFLSILTLGGYAAVVMFFTVSQETLPGILFVGGIILLMEIGIIVGVRRRLRMMARIVRTMKESRDRYAHALESAHTGTWEWIISEHAIIVYTSARWRDIYGYTEETAPKTFDEWLTLIHPDDMAAVVRLAHHAIATNSRAYTNEYRIKSGFSGEWRYVRDYGSIVAEEGSMKFIGSTHDETPVRTAEEILKRRTDELRRANTQIKEEIRNTRKFRQAVESSNEAIAITDPKGRVVDANNAWYTLIGMDAIHASKEFFASFEEHTESITMRHLKKALGDATSFISDDMRSVRPNHNGEEYTAEMSVSPVLEDGRAIFFVVIAEDITKRKEIDRAKTEFVSLASHQLRTPLSAIRWYSEMLMKEMGGSLTETQKSYLEEVYNANLRMIELVNALLNVSRIDMGTVQSVPEKLIIIPIVKSVLGELYPSIVEKKLSVHEEYAPDLPEQWFDPKQMRMIFQNLLSNAVKYTPEKGSIEVVVRTEGENIFFSISDSGIGIPKEQQPQIFNKLFRADNAREVDTTGTGLGLYIIKAVIEKHGGSLRFESEVGTGTTFYGILPIQKEKPAETAGSKPLI